MVGKITVIMVSGLYMCMRWGVLCIAGTPERGQCIFVSKQAHVALFAEPLFFKAEPWGEVGWGSEEMDRF